MAFTELQFIVAFISVLALGLLVKAVKVWYPSKTTEVDVSLDAMINGFDFALPEEVELYRKTKEENPKDLEKVFNMLFRRAVADIPLIRKIQSESAGIQRLKRNDILKDGSFLSYKLAEDLINEEVADVRREAELLRPGQGWADRIFSEAVAFMNHMAEQQMMQQRKAAEEQLEKIKAVMAAQGVPMTPETLQAAQAQAMAMAQAAAAEAQTKAAAEQKAQAGTGGADGEGGASDAKGKEKKLRKRK